MSENQLVKLAQFNSFEEAKELAEFLKSQEISTKIEDASPAGDLSFGGNDLSKEINVRVLKSDFEKANQLLEIRATEDLKSIPEDYHLFEYSDDELIEIVTKPDEWSNIDYLLAQKILKERGKEFSDAELKAFMQTRVQASRKLDQAVPFWIVFGFISAIFGGVIGIWMGYFYW